MNSFLLALTLKHPFLISDYSKTKSSSLHNSKIKLSLTQHLFTEYLLCAMNWMMQSLVGGTKARQRSSGFTFSPPPN